MNIFSSGTVSFLNRTGINKLTNKRRIFAWAHIQGLHLIVLKLIENNFVKFTIVFCAMLLFDDFQLEICLIFCLCFFIYL